MDKIHQHSVEFWKFFKTPFGFFLTVYILNVIGWGAMLFFLLLGVAPTMSHSKRLQWIEIVSQIMNSLFCVAAFFPAPWRIRDLYYLIEWRVAGNVPALQVLANIHHSWFRMNLVEDVIHDVTPKTERWKMDLVIYMLMLNTLNQVVLCYFMWGYGPSDRPVWAVALFVVLGCTFGSIAGIIIALETSRVKSTVDVEVQMQPLEQCVENQCKQGISSANRGAHQR